MSVTGWVVLGICGTVTVVSAVFTATVAVMDMLEPRK